MILDNYFTERLITELRKNSLHLYDICLAQIADASKTYFFSGVKVFEFNATENLPNVLKKIILNPINPYYNGRYIVYKRNDLFTKTPQEIDFFLASDFNESEEEAKRQFWRDNNNEEAYKVLSNFEAFKEVVIESKNFLKTASKGLFITESWANYIKQLFESFWPDYRMLKLKSSKGVVRFAKKISSGFWFCIEYDEGQLKQDLKVGRFNMPEVKLVLLYQEIDNDSLQKDIYRDIVFCVSLFEHPIFFNLCTDIISYTSKQFIRVEEYSGEISLNLVSWEKLENGQIKLYNSKDVADNIKRHCFFYMSIYRYYLTSYMKFLEGCIIDAIG